MHLRCLMSLAAVSLKILGSVRANTAVCTVREVATACFLATPDTPTLLHHTAQARILVSIVTSTHQMSCPLLVRVATTKFILKRCIGMDRSPRLQAALIRATYNRAFFSHHTQLCSGLCRWKTHQRRLTKCSLKFLSQHLNDTILYTSLLTTIRVQMVLPQAVKQGATLLVFSEDLDLALQVRYLLSVVPLIPLTPHPHRGLPLVLPISPIRTTILATDGFQETILMRDTDHDLLVMDIITATPVVVRCFAPEVLPRPPAGHTHFQFTGNSPTWKKKAVKLITTTCTGLPACTGADQRAAKQQISITRGTVADNHRV